ncbi:flagellin lysine-N-methylase [Rummeliibacillus suwonensis]|uniref:flagellin lysine-N-methylase n=1 Tax=Rummeliibacillus suwonensis TaxID=1306154 RepID=UPI001AAFBAD0|nr:flagellin lysine-N-methylase [Rummeliibacillus suwonensis]MBO2534273.1 flagellin lysine-N-methylase [Rummeliibacillus suwonensis]
MTRKSSHRLIPTYFVKFKCIGGKCEDTCCAGWQIDIDKKTFKKYKNETNPNIKDTLHQNIKRNRSNTVNDFNYGQFKLDENNCCTMLTNDGLCSIQKDLGEQSLCRTCTIYPREISEVNGIIEKSLLLSCPEAARIVLNRPEGIDFIEDEGTELISPTLIYHQTEEENTIFWKIRIFMIDTLQNRQHSLETRLLILSMFLQKYINLEKKTYTQVDDLIKHYINFLNNSNLGEAFANMPKNFTNQITLVSSVLNTSLTAEYNQFTKIVKSSLHLNNDDFYEIAENTVNHAFDTYYMPFIEKYEFILENFLVNAVYTHLKTCENRDLLGNFTTICVDFSILRLLIIGFAKANHRITIEDAIYCIQKYTKSLSHNASYKKEIANILQKDSSSVLSQITMIIFIGN